ncbi:MAG: AI-2E family transporter [Thermoplasmatota archaeon]
MVLSKRRLSPYFLFALLLLLAWISFRVIEVFLDYVLVGLFIGYLTFPAYRWLRPRLKRPPLAAFSMVIAVSILVLVPLGFATVGLVNELRNILISLDVDSLRAQLDTFLGDLGERFGRDPQQEGEPGVLDTVIPSISGYISTFVTRLIGVLAEALVGMFVLLYVLYYTYLDGERFVLYLRDLLPLQDAHRDLIFHEITIVTQAVMYGSVLVAFLQAVLGALGFMLFGVPNVIFWGFVMFILALLPVIGPPLIYVPWSVYLIGTGETFRGIGLLVYSVILVSTLDNFIRPALISSRAHIHPVIILLGVLGGLAFFGFSGFILGPLVLSIFVTILGFYRKEFALKTEEPEFGYGGNGS